jgi:hypothetical protein
MAPEAARSSPKDILEGLHGICTATLNRSFDGEFAAMMARSFVFANDLSTWAQLISDRPERFLLAKASEEYLVAILNLVQGQYRNAFKGLRLVLELSLQGVYLSANLVELQEWMNNSRDTIWSNLTDPNKGPLTRRFVRAFFPEIEEHSNNFQSLAETLYRELSEAIHGNVPLRIPLPDSFNFDERTFKLWHEKATTVRMILHFCFGARYLKSLNEDKRAMVEQPITEELGHIEAIRTLLGGPRT